jgi:hypothetical protein
MLRHGDDVITARKPSSAYFLMNSGDRNLVDSQNNVEADAQRWNSFSINKNQPLLPSFAKTIAISEVLFPWCIPNVTEKNNTFKMLFGYAENKYTITIPVGFYTGDALATTVSTAIAAAITAAPPVGYVTPPTVTWSDAQKTFTFNIPISVGTSSVFSLAADTTFSQLGYYTQPSLLKTMGFSFGQIASSIMFLTSSTQTLTGGATFIRYTSWVDIVSQRLNYTTNARDGDTSQRTASDLVMRIYCANETSTAEMTGTVPFVIHRQFETPKVLHADPRAFLTSLDIEVLDEYGQLVWVPPTTSNGKVNTKYPDFQITFIASEA